MTKKPIKLNIADEDFFDLLEGKLVERELAKIRKSENISIDHVKLIFETGVDFYNNFQFKEAEIIFSAYVSLNPYDHRGAGCLAAIYLEKGQFKEALNILNILKTYPTNDLDETILNISLCHYKLEEHTQASAMLLIVKPENLNDFNQKRYGYLQRQLKPYLS